MYKLSIVALMFSLISVNSFARGGGRGEKISACEGKAVEQMCSYEKKDKVINGKCVESRKKSGVLVCKGPKKHKEFSVLKDLNLSAEQISKVEKFKESQGKNKNEECRKIKNHRKLMSDLFIANKPDIEFEKLHEKVGNCHKLKMDKRLEKMVFIKNLLNDDQRKKYVELREGYKGKKKGHKRCKR